MIVQRSIILKLIIAESVANLWTNFPILSGDNLFSLCQNWGTLLVMPGTLLHCATPAPPHRILRRPALGTPAVESSCPPTVPTCTPSCKLFCDEVIVCQVRRLHINYQLSLYMDTSSACCYNPSINYYSLKDLFKLRNW